MGKFKPVAITMVIVMIVTMLTSCSFAKKGDNVVKEDDPWYDTVRFKLERDLKPTDELGEANICTSDDRFYYVYCYSGDKWGSSKTKLDTYDYEGNLLNSLKVTCPEHEGFYIGRIYSVSANPDGKTIDAIIYFNSADMRAHAFASIDIETGIISNIKDVFEGEVMKLRKSGTSVSYISGFGEYAVAVLDYMEESYISYQALLFKNQEFVAELDTSTIKLSALMDGFSLNVSSDSLYAVGWEMGKVITMEFDLRNGQLKSKNSSGSSDENSINFAEYIATDKGEMCKIDSFGNIMKIDVATMTEQTVVETNWYTPRFVPVDTDEHFYGSQIFSCSEERTLIMETETTMYGLTDWHSADYVRVLTKADKNPHAGKEIIELALPLDSGLTVYLAESVYEFNASNDEYLIRLWDKYKTGFTVGRGLATVDENDEKMYQMIQDLKGDEAPDLAIGIQNNYAMRDDVFMDLSDFLEPEVLEKQYGNIIEAGRIDGKLYFLPVSIVIEGLVTNADLVEDGAVGIDFEDYDKLVSGAMNGYSPYDYPLSDSFNKQAFFLSCIDTKSAIEGETIDFGTEQFRAAAEYSRVNFAYDDANDFPNDIDQYNRNRGECYYANIADFLDYVHACYKSDGQYLIIGTPSVDKTGPRFKALETISVSATTDVEEGCRKFINYLFSGTAFDNDSCEFWQIVTNKEIMSRNVDVLFQRNNEAEDDLIRCKEVGAVAMTEGAEKAGGDKYATEDMCEIFLDSLSTISTYYYEDKRIVQFVNEELAPYYAGDRTLDDCIMYLNDRAAKYIREM
ncbi:MAG: hypothetical protein K6E12_03455 [Saccharofermentans sp.]|nr:hypothetical protein [Saccharofermentans sp.]